MANFILEISFFYSCYKYFSFFINYKKTVLSAFYKSGLPGLVGGIILSVGFASYVFAMYEYNCSKC